MTESGSSIFWFMSKWNWIFTKIVFKLLLGAVISIPVVFLFFDDFSGAASQTLLLLVILDGVLALKAYCYKALALIFEKYNL